MYGGTITSVLLRLPGEAASVVTCFDGHQMARQGRAGPALGIAAFGSFIGGIVAGRRPGPARPRRWPAGRASSGRRSTSALTRARHPAGHLPGHRLPVKSLCMAALGPAAGHDRPGPDHGHDPVHLRPGRAVRRAGLRRASPWACSASARSSTASSSTEKAGTIKTQISEHLADRAGLQGVLRGDRARLGARVLPRRAARRRRGDLLPCLLRGGEAPREGPERGSARAPSRGSPAPRRRTTRRRPRRFVPLLTLGIPSNVGAGADLRGAAHPGRHARAAADRPSTRRSSGASSPRCSSAT